MTRQRHAPLSLALGSPRVRSVVEVMTEAVQAAGAPACGMAAMLARASWCSFRRRGVDDTYSMHEGLGAGAGGAGWEPVVGECGSEVPRPCDKGAAGEGAGEEGTAGEEGAAGEEGCGEGCGEAPSLTRMAKFSGLGREPIGCGERGERACDDPGLLATLL